MVERRPIVLVDGELQEFPSGDTLPASIGGGGGTPTSVLSNIFIEDQTSATGYDASISTTSAATKGNRVSSQFDVDLKTVQFEANEATSQTYEAVVAEISGTTIGTIIGRVSAVSVGGTDELLDITFTTPLRLVALQNYVILITQLGGTGTTVLDSASGSGPLIGVVTSNAIGGYIADNDIQGSETFISFGSTYIGMSLTYDIAFNANGIGSGILSGAVDPTTEGLDGDWYINTVANTIFGPKAAGTWPAGTSFIGPPGSPGADGADGAIDAFFANEIPFTPGGVIASSTSAYGTKGNLHRMLGAALITEVTVNLTSVGNTDSFEVVLGVMSDGTSSATISGVAKQSFTGATGANVISLTVPYYVPRGAILLVGATNLTSGSSADPGIQFYNAETDYSGNVTLIEVAANARGARFLDADIINGDSPFDLTTSYWAIEFKYKPLNALLPVGGTTDQILSKIDGSDFNAQWVDNVSSSMVQTELTGTTHTVDDTDLAGNVVRRLNNAAAITVTVAPSLTGTEPATFIQTGAGAVTFAAGAGVTVHSAGGNLTIGAQYGSASLIPDATTADTYYLVGHLIA